jgi:hypothetical protein
MGAEAALSACPRLRPEDCDTALAPSSVVDYCTLKRHDTATGTFLGAELRRAVARSATAGDRSMTSDHNSVSTAERGPFTRRPRELSTAAALAELFDAHRQKRGSVPIACKTGAYSCEAVRLAGTEEP